MGVAFVMGEMWKVQVGSWSGNGWERAGGIRQILKAAVHAKMLSLFQGDPSFKIPWTYVSKTADKRKRRPTDCQAAYREISKKNFTYLLWPLVMLFAWAGGRLDWIVTVI